MSMSSPGLTIQIGAGIAVTRQRSGQPARRKPGKGSVVDRLSPLDALFVNAEDQDKQASFAIASVAVFEGPRTLIRGVPDRRRGRQAAAGADVPQEAAQDTVQPRASGLGGRPAISTSATTSGRPRCPRPAATSSSAGLVARVMSQRLDRNYPLWEYWLVEGLDQGPLGADVQGPSLHGGRHLRNRPVPRDLRPDSPSPRRRPWITRRFRAEPSGAALAVAGCPRRPEAAGAGRPGLVQGAH